VRSAARPATAGELLVNKSDLVARLTARLDGDRTAATAAVNGVLEEIEQSLARGERVTLPGFGTFDRRVRGPRTGRNPATGQTIQIGTTVAPVFRAGAGLRQVVTQAVPAAVVAVVPAPSDGTRSKPAKPAQPAKAATSSKSSTKKTKPDTGKAGKKASAKSGKKK
jgi:DNA-binding protein HU-beta